MRSDVGFGGEVVGVVCVDIEVVGLQMADDGDMGRSLKVPELKTREFVDNDGICRELVENVEGGGADVADEVSVSTLGIEEGFDEGAGGAFALSGGDADDGAGAVVEKVLGDGGFVLETQWWYGWAAEKYIIR